MNEGTVRNKALRRLDIGTLAQGLTAGLTMTAIALLTGRVSLTAAGVFSACVAIGMMSSKTLTRLTPRTVSVVLTVARTAALLAAFAGIFPVVWVLAIVIGAASRRIYIELKLHISEIDAHHLVAHSSWNAVAFGVGAGFSGFLIAYAIPAQIVALVVALVAHATSPTVAAGPQLAGGGLARRDLVTSVVYSFASNPLTNATAPVLIAALVSERAAGFSAFVYTCGAFAAPKVARLLGRVQRPVAVGMGLSAVTFVTILVAPSPAVVFLSRFVAGALLFGVQGVLEMRSQGEGDGHGLERLWTMLSAAGVVANFVVPASVDLIGLNLVPAWVVVGAGIIAVLEHQSGARTTDEEPKSPSTPQLT